MLECFHCRGFCGCQGSSTCKPACVTPHSLPAAFIALCTMVYVTHVPYHAVPLLLAGLTGTIPPELGQLSRLTDLAMQYNQLTGTLPPEMCGTPPVNRSSAGAGANRTGTVQGPALWTRLRDLFVRGNRLSGTVDLANCVELINLDLQVRNHACNRRGGWYQANSSCTLITWLPRGDR